MLFLPFFILLSFPPPSFESLYTVPQPSFLHSITFDNVNHYHHNASDYDFRSRAIARYLATKHNASNLIPLSSDNDYIKKLAKFETAASIEYSNFDPLASGIAKEAIFKPMFVSLLGLTLSLSLSLCLPCDTFLWEFVLMRYLSGSCV